MNKKYLLYLMGAISPFSSAYSMTVGIDTKAENFILVGTVNNEVATNYLDDKLLELKWIDRNGQTISNKPYLIPKNSINNVRFCASTANTTRCSNTWSNNSAKSLQYRNLNAANLTVRVLNSNQLSQGEPVTSISDFDIIRGTFGFHYTEQLDQQGHVIKSTISYAEPSIYQTVPSLSSNVRSVKACSVGGFLLSEPTYIESCTSSYPVDVSPEPAGSALCLYKSFNYEGKKKCFNENQVNHSKEMTSPRFPYLMSDYGLEGARSFQVKPGYRATVGDFSGHNNDKHSTWNRNNRYFEFILGDYIPDQIRHVFFERDDTHACFFEHHALHYGAFENSVSQCVNSSGKIDLLTKLKSGLQRTLSTVTLHPGLEVTLYSDELGTKKLGTYNEAKFWTGSPHPNDRAKSFKISVNKNYSFFRVSSDAQLRSLENSSLALRNLIYEKGDLHLITSDNNWTRNFVLPEGVREYTRLKFQRNSNYYFNVIDGGTTYRPNRGETLILTYINNRWVVSNNNGDSFSVFNSLYNGCFDFKGGASSGKDLTLNQSCNQTSPQKLVYDGSSKQIKISGTNYCLDVKAGSNSHRQPVIAYQCHSGSNQKWEFSSDKTIRSLLGGTQRCLDVDQHRRDSAGNPTLTLWACSPQSRDQQFETRLSQ
ncbi:ricin-type beta-trefoil lectin domain protein [Vibrio sp. TBV020]|uniref:ricin-type beta-trefoil lectin domain protein n=1 Tax=Vibrio sp. TBV020 TaxID=3137398 RepID=UPI0038CD456E